MPSLPILVHSSSSDLIHTYGKDVLKGTMCINIFGSCVCIGKDAKSKLNGMMKMLIWMWSMG